MPWQDILITVGTVFLIIALLPSVFGGNKPALATSLMTGSVLASFSFTYFTLGLVFATATTATSALLWLILAFQVLGQKKTSKKIGKKNK